MVDITLERQGTKWQSTLSYRHQDGYFPTSRLGHTLNRVSDGHVLLYGGRERIDQRTAPASQIFADCTPANLFSYDIETGTWLRTPICGDIPGGQAYHTTTTFSNNELLVLGGVEFTMPQTTTGDLPAFGFAYNESQQSYYKYPSS